MDLSVYLENGFLHAILLQTTPILLAALAGAFSHQANILNLGLEGTILIAAFTSIAVGFATQSAELGVLAAVLAASAVALVHAGVTLGLRADNNMVGIGINLLGSGLTVFLLSALFNTRGAYSPMPFPPLWRLDLGPAAELPVIGALHGLSIICVVTPILLLASHFVLYRTSYGIRLRAVGESAGAAEASGIGVARMQTSAMLLSGMLSGLAGAQLAMGTIEMFVAEMSAGRGFIGLAASVFGGGTPFGSAIGALIFGAADAAATTMQITSSIPPQLVLMTPYAVTLIVLVMARSGMVSRIFNRRRTVLAR